MSTYKHLADLLKICSVLPALAIMPAMAENAQYSNPTDVESWIENTYDVDDDTSRNGGVLKVESGKEIDAINAGTVSGNTVNLIKTESSSGEIYGQGSVLYNNGSIGAITGTFENNSVVNTSDTVNKGKATVNGGAFALYGGTNIGSITGDFTGNSAIAKYAGEGETSYTSGDQISAGGGAMHIQGAFGEGPVTIGRIEGNFTGNSAHGDGYANGGALYIKAGANDREGVDKYGVQIDEIVGNFDGNFAVATTGTNDNKKDSTGGAISIKEDGEYSVVANINGNFTNNYVSTNSTNALGGAIYNEGTLTVNGDFIANKAISESGKAYGGAIYNTGDATVSGLYSENSAISGGGAIYNTFEKTSIADAVFIGNTAGVSGGAIYNEAVAKMKLAGNNVFAGNTAAGVANDIHNDGIIDVASGTTTIGSGISGTGSLNIAEGATLNIGTTTVQQDSINLDGTLAAQIVNANSFGKLQISEISVGENGVLDLALGSVGTYDFGTIVPVEKIAYNDAVYNVDFNENNQMIVSTKSVDEIVSNTNLSSNAATTVSVLANVENDLLNTISLRAQQDLAAGNVDRVEAETAKLNPEDKPVAQSVATSVQNQVMSLAAGRMSGAPTVGRSGGDLADADYGVWAQGLYNHSKYNGKFTGDTMGISVGVDTLIDGKYTVGIGYAYNDTDVDSDSRDTDIESNSIFVYGQYKPAEWYINAALNYTMSNYKESSDPYGIVYESEYDVNSFGGQVAAGYDFAFGLTPEVGVRYLNVSQDAYESLMGHIDGVDTNYLTGVAGVKYAFEIETDSELSLRPELRAAATYDFLSDSAVATITAPGNLSYVIDADRLSRLGGEFGIGLVGNYKGVEVSLNYDLDLHEDYTSHTGMLKFRYNF